MKKYLLILLSTVLVAGLLTGCARNKEDKSLTERQMYEKAKQKLLVKNFELAIEQFEELQATYPYGDYTTQSEIEICYAYYKTREAERAIPCVDRFLAFHPTHPHIDYAYYLKGLASLPVRTPKFAEKYFKTQEQFSDHDVESARDAYYAFNVVVEKFPLSDYAESARRILIDLINTFARHDLRIARFYLHRDAHVAAINRSQQVLEQYSNSPHTEEALAILVYSYTQLGLDELALDSQRVLALNFPNSEFLQSTTSVLNEELIEAKNRRVLMGLFQ